MSRQSGVSRGAKKLKLFSSKINYAKVFEYASAALWNLPEWQHRIFWVSTRGFLWYSHLWSETQCGTRHYVLLVATFNRLGSGLGVMLPRLHCKDAIKVTRACANINEYVENGLERQLLVMEINILSILHWLCSDMITIVIRPYIDFFQCDLCGCITAFHEGIPVSLFGYLGKKRKQKNLFVSHSSTSVGDSSLGKVLIRGDATYKKYASFTKKNYEHQCRGVNFVGTKM